MAFNNRIVSGADEIATLLLVLPQASATHLQFVLRRNAIDHKNEIVRSSTFKNINRNSLRQLIRAWPGKVTPRKSLAQVKAGTDVYWKGLGEKSPANGVAARIEKRIGSGITTPTQSRFLLIPQGDMLSKGKPRRVNQGGTLKKVAVRSLPGQASSQNRRVGGKNVPILQSGTLQDTVVLLGKRGLFLIQKLPKAKRGKFEPMTYDAEGKRINARKLKDRYRIIGILRRSARQARPLDFFGSWDRLRGSRDARYERMLDDVVNGRKARAAA